jgi:hypothetical protein
MLCFIACCFIGGKSKNHERLNELSHRYSPNQFIKINGKNWIFIRYQSNGNCWMYSYEKCAGKFITTFGLFHLNAMGDFIQLSFADGVDKIETAHDHAPTVCGKCVEVKLSNEKRIDVFLSGNSLFYDNYCSIREIK